MLFVNGTGIASDALRDTEDWFLVVLTVAPTCQPASEQTGPGKRFEESGNPPGVRERPSRHPSANARTSLNRPGERACRWRTVTIAIDRGAGGTLPVQQDSVPH